MAPPTVQLLEALQVEVLLVQVDATNGACSRVKILVRAPGGEVDFPLVQLELDVANGVRQIPADVAALQNRSSSLSIRPRLVAKEVGEAESSYLGMSGSRDLLDVEELAGEVVNTAEEHECNAVALLVDPLHNVLSSEARLALKEERQLTAVTLETCANFLTSLGFMRINASLTCKL